MIEIEEYRAFPTLACEVGEWSKQNFGEKQNPYLGMVEELGELAHCVLKRFQGIRGYDKSEVFLVDYCDALGDICIYAANYAYNEHLVLAWPVIKSRTSLNHTRHIAAASFWLSRMLLTPEIALDTELSMKYFLTEVAYLAHLENLELANVANETWKKVLVRDWKGNKDNGEKTY